MEVLGLIYLIVAGFALVVGILWVCMPFAIFGTKDKLQLLIDETKANTAAVNDLHQTMKEGQK